ncbi:DNA repair protein rhp54 [Hordeum vulgare]|nr:DNA repair protein rhp54 [Hordeum vulgare]
MLGLNPSQHGLANAAVAAAVSTGSSAFPRTVLPDSPDASACHPVPGFHVYPQASRLLGECSPEVSMVAPSTPAPAPIDPNATPVAAGSSAGGARKRARQTPADQLPDARNLFDEMPAAGDDDYMQNMIFEGGAQAPGFDPDETQSQDGRGPFTPPAGYNEDQAAFMRDQVGLDLDGFPLDHEFPEDYGLEEEDEYAIEAEPLFEDELANQADRPKPKRKSKRTKAYTTAEDKFLCECWRDIGQDPKTGAEQKHSTFWIRVHHEFHERKKFPSYQIVSVRGHFKLWRHSRSNNNGKSFNLFHCFRVIKDEEKFKAQYAALKSRGGKQAVGEVGDGEKARPRGKTNSKKEDKRDAASVALIATVKGMITKDSREEKRRQEREEQMNAFLEIQRRRLDIEGGEASTDA